MGEPVEVYGLELRLVALALSGDVQHVENNALLNPLRSIPRMESSSYIDAI
jgi:hypothetical protein